MPDCRVGDFERGDRVQEATVRFAPALARGRSRSRLGMLRDAVPRPARGPTDQGLGDSGGDGRICVFVPRRPLRFAPGRFPAPRDAGRRDPERSEGNRRATGPKISEATVGFEPTYEGFAGPDTGDSDPCSPFSGFRVRVCCFPTAWRTQTLDRLLGPGNRHKIPYPVRWPGYISKNHESRDPDDRASAPASCRS